LFPTSIIYQKIWFCQAEIGDLSLFFKVKKLTERKSGGKIKVIKTQKYGFKK